MRNLLIKHFVLDWKFTTNLPLIFGFIFSSAVVPTFILDKNIAYILASLVLVSLVSGIIMKYKNYGTIGVSVVRPAFIIYTILSITGIFIINKNFYIGYIGSALAILLYFVPYILIKYSSLKFSELDSSQKWQLGSLYLDGLTKIDNPYMSDTDWEQWKLLNTYYLNKNKTINHII